MACVCGMSAECETDCAVGFPRPGKVPMQQVLYLPLTGEAEHHTFKSDADLVVHSLMLEHGGHGVYVKFDIEVDGKSGGAVAFLTATPEAPPNQRAQQALTFLTGTYMRITGDACFINIDPTLVNAIAGGEDT